MLVIADSSVGVRGDSVKIDTEFAENSKLLLTCTVYIYTQGTLSSVLSL